MLDELIREAYDSVLFAERPEAECPATGRPHRPDWLGMRVARLNVHVRIDVNCADCGRSGCIGDQEILEKGIEW